MEDRFIIFIILGGLKFETKASQVQLFCLHVVHSDVVDTLGMHIKYLFNGNIVEKNETRKSDCVSTLVVSMLELEVILYSFKIQSKTEREFFLLSSRFVYLCVV